MLARLFPAAAPSSLPAPLPAGIGTERRRTGSSGQARPNNGSPDGSGALAQSASVRVLTTRHSGCSHLDRFSRIPGRLLPHPLAVLEPVFSTPTIQPVSRLAFDAQRLLGSHLELRALKGASRTICPSHTRTPHHLPAPFVISHLKATPAPAQLLHPGSCPETRENPHKQLSRRSSSALATA